MKLRLVKPISLSCAILSLVVVSSVAFGADPDPDPNAATNAATAAIHAETARINAQAALETAKATRDASKVSNLGLPQFDNKTTIESGGGEIEANLLASRAVHRAAEMIAASVKSTCQRVDASPTCPNASVVYVISPGNDSIDFNLPEQLRARLASVSAQLSRAIIQAEGKSTRHADQAFVAIVPALIAAVKAAASLLANETHVSAVKLDSINDAMLANAVAGELKGMAILPSGSVGTADLKNSKLFAEVSMVGVDRDTAAALVAKNPEKPNASQKASLESLTLAIKSYDDFFNAVTTANSVGRTPMIEAILIDQIADYRPILVKVAVNKAGGSLINTKNIATMFGIDPVKVSGGLVASYAAINPKNGIVEAAGIVTCQTSLASLRKIQNGRWTAWDKGAPVKENNLAVCN